LPFKRTKRAADATDDYFRYINEMLDERIEAAEKLSKGTANDVEGMDLMGHLARESRGKSGLTRDEIVGNTFVLQVAGHETTANTLHFSCVYLACYPEAQRKMQRQIDIMFGGSDPATWDYNKHINALLASTVGAVMYETLRLIPSVPEIPKTTLEDQPITMDGVEYIVPKGTVISLGALSAQINPRYWPTQPSKRREGEDDMLDFVPDRWYRPSLTEEFSDDDDDDDEKTDSEEYRDEAGPTTSSALYRPIRGSYIPFSDGPRSCLGRRFAQTEVVATLAVIFREYSMELEVDHLASDSEVEQMPTKDRETVYHKAREQCLSTLDGARTMISLRLINGEKVPIRLVKRGQERFVDRVEY
jgi:cytochrome P450